MCDYSMDKEVTRRDAEVGDKLMSSNFPNTLTRGFQKIGAPYNEATCLLPGTELSFELDIVFYDPDASFICPVKTGATTAIFRQVETDDPYTHHDALELPSGKIVKVTYLDYGQRCTVLQLPASEQVRKKGFFTRALESMSSFVLFT